MHHSSSDQRFQRTLASQIESNPNHHYIIEFKRVICSYKERSAITNRVPDGIYRAILLEVVDATKISAINADIRFKWKITYPTEQGKDYLVGKNYKINNQSPLINDLQSWFPEGLHEFELAPGQLDLAKLVGKEADLVIGHKMNDSHQLPFVYIRSVHPPGKLVKFLSNVFIPFQRTKAV